MQRSTRFSPAAVREEARREVGGADAAHAAAMKQLHSERAKAVRLAEPAPPGPAAREDSSVVSGIAASDAARGWGVVSWLLRLSWRRVSRLMSTKKSSVS